MRIKLKIVFLFLIVFVGCNQENPLTPSELKAPEWKPGSITQEVPSWGSSTRLILPVNASQFILGDFGSIGGFGSHQGGHIEGLDHVWIDVENGIPIKSWADGTVAKIEDMGGEYFITIEYADGLTGKHMEVETPLVKVGQKVKAGDPVCYGISYASYQSAEFMLMDKKRNDGQTGGGIGSCVSPFDYLRADQKALLETEYINKIVKPFFLSGKDAGANRRVEPFLTNQLIFHKYFRNTMAGEWMLKSSKWGPGGQPDILTLIDANNEYFTGKKIVAGDYMGQGNNVIDGTWSSDSTAHTFIFIIKGITYYGIYELDETNGRAALKIEYNPNGYPASFSPAASVYIERAPISLYEDATNLGLI